MSANPDPRLDEIQARLDECRPCGTDCGSTECQTERDAKYLLAELRKAREALARVEGLTLDPEHYDSRGPSNGYVSVDDIRAAVAAANGDGQ